MGGDPIGQQHAFLIAGGEAARVANDVCDFRYRARLRRIAGGCQQAATINPAAETQMLVESGWLEVMVGGATATIAAGGFVRVPPGVVFAWRNADTVVVNLLVHTVTPGQACPTTTRPAPT